MNIENWNEMKQIFFCKVLLSKDILMIRKKSEKCRNLNFTGRIHIF